MILRRSTEHRGTAAWQGVQRIKIEGVRRASGAIMMCHPRICIPVYLYRPQTGRPLNPEEHQVRSGWAGEPMICSWRGVRTAESKERRGRGRAPCDVHTGIVGSPTLGHWNNLHGYARVRPPITVRSEPVLAREREQGTVGLGPDLPSGSVRVYIMTA